VYPSLEKRVHDIGCLAHIYSLQRHESARKRHDAHQGLGTRVLMTRPDFNAKCQVPLAPGVRPTSSTSDCALVELRLLCTKMDSSFNVNATTGAPTWPKPPVLPCPRTRRALPLLVRMWASTRCALQWLYARQFCCQGGARISLSHPSVTVPARPCEQRLSCLYSPQAWPRHAHPCEQCLQLLCLFLYLPGLVRD
jgi:hypothetical protein